MRPYLRSLALACFGAATIATSAQAAEHEIKLSVLAPEGSTWVKEMEAMNQELQAKSGGKLALKIYAGGVSGDEKDVLRKMRIGQVHAAAFTGVGLGQIVPSVRILELPMLFRNYQEVDYVKGKLQPEFDKQFDANGFVLLGWAEAGFVNIFSNKPIANKEDMKGVKMWAWEGDPLVKAMYETLGIVPIPLALPDVLTSLQTNLIDGVYGPPLGVIALQWFTKVKYMTEANLANSTGGLLISKAQFAKLPPDLQTLLKETGAKYGAQLVQKIRAENTSAIATLKKNGIQMVAVDPKAKEEMIQLSEAVYPKLAGNL
ncbi:MAG: TRAP transporter substrate-binding protein DctP, partial [Deltaproteobacteria bacterium]|nr:TRAP transporter substrate-binding protein DctP [Deltaproteobacteria bacterium]